jgi:hypothetical protein
MSNFIKVFYVLSVFNFASLEIFLHFGGIPKDKKYIFNPFGLIYLTNQTNLMLVKFIFIMKTIYFILRLISDVFNLKRINKQLDYFSGFLLTVGTFMFLGYYILIHNDPKIPIALSILRWWNPFSKHFIK